MGTSALMMWNCSVTLQNSPETSCADPSPRSDPTCTQKRGGAGEQAGAKAKLEALGSERSGVDAGFFFFFFNPEGCRSQNLDVLSPPIPQPQTPRLCHPPPMLLPLQLRTGSQKSWERAEEKPSLTAVALKLINTRNCPDPRSPGMPEVSSVPLPPEKEEKRADTW